MKHCIAIPKKYPQSLTVYFIFITVKMLITTQLHFFKILPSGKKLAGQALILSVSRKCILKMMNRYEYYFQTLVTTSKSRDWCFRAQEAISIIPWSRENNPLTQGIGKSSLGWIVLFSFCLCALILLLNTIKAWHFLKKFIFTSSFCYS